MDADEERVLYLTRLGHEKVIKRGTYDMRNYRPITQDHPFYAYKTIAESEAYFREVERLKAEEDEPIPETVSNSFNEVSSDAGISSSNIGMEASVDAVAAPMTDTPAADDNPDALASEILSSNFKVGMSQEEVDDFLKGLLGG